MERRYHAPLFPFGVICAVTVFQTLCFRQAAENHSPCLKFELRRCALPGQSGEARIFLIQDDNLTAEVPLRRSILQSTLRQKYRSTGRHNPQRDGGPEKGLYRLHPIALCALPLRANGDETKAPRKFRLEGVGELSRGHAQ